MSQEKKKKKHALWHTCTQLMTNSNIHIYDIPQNCDDFLVVKNNPACYLPCLASRRTKLYSFQLQIIGHMCKHLQTLLGLLMFAGIGCDKAIHVAIAQCVTVR